VLEDVLRSNATSFQSWSTFLPMAEFAINNAVHTSTGLTPFFVNNGRHPLVPALLGLERSSSGNDAEESAPSAPIPPPGSHGVNAVSTRSMMDSRATGVRTRAATRAVPERVADWTTRTLLRPPHRRVIALQDDAGAASPAAPLHANFDPVPVPQPSDVAAVTELLQQRESVIRNVCDAIATAVDRQKENADRRGRKILDKFHVGGRVLLSTAGISPTLVTNLGANKLAPRFIGPFKITKVLEDAFTLQLPTALRLDPAFYVGRLRRYDPATTPSDADDPSDYPAPTNSSGHHAGRRGAVASDSSAPDDPVGRPSAQEAVRSQRSPAAPRFQRDGPAPLVDSAGHVRHIVDAILRHDDTREIPQPTRQGRGARRRDDRIAPHRQYLVRWLGPMEDSWDPRGVLLADVPDVVAAYEVDLAQMEGAELREGAAARRA
jgi:hypothetical protein